MSDYSGQVNGILGNIEIYGANAASSITSVGWGGSYDADQSTPYSTEDEPFLINGVYSVNGVYGGSLSALGNMVAMSLNDTGEYKRLDKVTGEPALATSVISTPRGFYSVYANNPNGVNTVPWMVGYFRSYWRDPTRAIFGANSAIPAITGVMPERFTDMQGNFVYYVDLQLTRLSGNNSWDNFYFINAFNQLIGWLTTANTFTKGLLNTESQNLQYFGFNSYDDLITQGWNAYKASEALPAAFDNLGVLVETIPLGYFGTSNGVVKSMIDHGLGAIGNLSQQLYAAGIVYQEIGNPDYTAQLDAILKTITNSEDLSTVQAVLRTTVRADLFSSPLSYTQISFASGKVNDSGFADMAEVGRDIYLKAPGANFETGSDVATLIRNIQTSTSESIEELKTDSSLLTPEIIADLRQYLPMTADNAPISILDVIGTAAGYYTEYIELVNEGIAELYATDYGPQLIKVLSEITRYGAAIAINQSEINAALAWRPVPVDTGPGYWRYNQELKMAEYLALLDTVAADPAMQTTVEKINSNYDKACERVYIEHKNYNKANVEITSYSDNSQIFGFVSSIPGYAVDPGNIGTDYFLYQLSTPSTAGNIAQNLINQSKNSDSISNVGGRVSGAV